jgi:putative aminopeptidase FrvX
MIRMAATALGMLGILIMSGPGGTRFQDPESAWSWLKQLLPIPGVSGHEEAVADVVLESLPDGLDVKRDDMHNVWFTVGKGRPHLVFVAHTDELGLEVTDITPEGRLKVAGRGGFLSQMYEGRPVKVFTARGPRNGIVLPRAGYSEPIRDLEPINLADMEIYLGVQGREAALALGVEVGDPVTIRKRITELTPDLLASRAVDDRAGCAVLLAAAHRIPWSRVSGRTVTFAWDVQEEVGLVGARKLAEQLDADYVFPVDTFVSTDAPLDDQRFARIPLGKGLVIRGMDSSTIAPRYEMEKVMAVARKRGIPFHLGNTRGGTDGTRFIPEGAVNLPLSWPGTYSHSFIEKIHRKDLQALTDLVVALVQDFR